MIEANMNMDINCIMNLSEEQKIAFLRAFSKMANADNMFDESEKDFIRNAAVNFGISSDKASAALENLDEEEIIRDVSTITDRRAALELIKEMCVLAHADDHLSDKETLFIGKIGLAMGVELEKIEQISNWVIERLIWLEQGKIIFEEV